MTQPAGIRLQATVTANALTVSGTAIIDGPRPDIHRGDTFTYHDHRCRTTGTVTRRYTLRNGNIKLWLTGLEQDLTYNNALQQP